MKIANKLGQGIQGAEAAKTTKADASKKFDKAQGSPFNGVAKGGDTAQVKLSERAMAMQKAKEIASQDAVDEAKVARLQKLIDEGKYKVDSKAVADRLVDEHLSMLE